VPNEPTVSTKSGLLFERYCSFTAGCLNGTCSTQSHTGRWGGEPRQPLHGCPWRTPTVARACHNGNHFADDVCKNFTRRSILGWVNRLA
ncbi:hypothetical protein ACJX0J_042140, partial [Zea mays]